MKNNYLQELLEFKWVQYVIQFFSPPDFLIYKA